MRKLDEVGSGIGSGIGNGLNPKNQKNQYQHMGNHHILGKLNALLENSTNNKSQLDFGFKKLILVCTVGMLTTLCLKTHPQVENIWFLSQGNDSLTLESISHIKQQQAGAPSSPATISTRQAATKAKAYKQSIQALETPPTITDDQVKEQGFVIRPIDGYKIRTTSAQKIEEPPDSAFRTQVNSATAQGYKNAQALTHKTRNVIEGFSSNRVSEVKKLINGQSYNEDDPDSSQHHYSMDQTNRRILLTNAKNLSVGTPRTIAKKTLGRPSKETIVALPESRELAKMLVYTIKLWRQGVSTPDRDEKLILVFNSDDRLMSVGLDKGANDSYQPSRSRECAHKIHSQQPRLASAARY
jgi:hypothetical protein